MNDRVLAGFLELQHSEGTALAAASDVLDLLPLGERPFNKYLARFTCQGLVRADDGNIVEAGRFVAGIWFQDDHLRKVDPPALVTLLDPPGVFHPNVRGPFVCLGRVGAGISLTSVCYQVFEILTYNRYQLADALNPEAAGWARRNMSRFPVDRRPLKRSLGPATTAPPGDLAITVVEVSS